MPYLRKYLDSIPQYPPSLCRWPSPPIPPFSFSPLPPPPPMQVAMAVGYLDPIPVERVRAARRQVLVVLTASWQVWGNVGKRGEGVSESAPCLMRTAAGVTVPFRGMAVWGISR